MILIRLIKAWPLTFRSVGFCRWSRVKGNISMVKGRWSKVNYLLSHAKKKKCQVGRWQCRNWKMGICNCCESRPRIPVTSCQLTQQTYLCRPRVSYVSWILISNWWLFRKSKTAFFRFCVSIPKAFAALCYFFHRVRKKREREDWLQMLTKHAQSEKVLDPRSLTLEP